MILDVAIRQAMPLLAGDELSTAYIFDRCANAVGVVLGSLLYDRPVDTSKLIENATADAAMVESRGPI
jgi:hypothetical protein